MKVSKVNHARTAVGCNNKSTDGAVEAGAGFLYNNPGGVKDIKTHIKEQNKKNQRLYNVIIYTEKGDKNYSLAVNNFNKIIKRLLEKGDIEKQLQVLQNLRSETIEEARWDKRNKRNISEKKGENFFVKAPQKTLQELVHRLVEQNLRKSLRKKVVINKECNEKIYIPDIIEKLMYATCLGRNYDVAFQKIELEELRCMLEVLNEDYKKEKQIEQLAISIQKKNVPVYVEKRENGKHYLALSVACNTKKQYIIEFVKKYADSDDATRKELEEIIKKLIEIYYTPCKEDSEVICEKIKDLLLEKGKGNLSKDDIRVKNREINEAVSEWLSARYKSIQSREDEDIKAFKGWVDFISNEAEKILRKKHLKPYQVQCEYLIKKTWQAWLSFVAKKYIDLGKATYNFAMEQISDITSGKEVSFGIVNEDYKNGISSFDYERMKAEDSLSRSMIKYILFAVNNFDASVRKEECRNDEGKEDILTIDLEQECLRDDAMKRVLRFFGGESCYVSSKTVESQNERLAYESGKVIKQIKDNLYIARNYSFHFAPGKENKDTEFSEILKIFDFEVDSIKDIYRKMYESNNVFLFYDDAEIKNLIKKTSCNRCVIPAQIPSFNKVLSRNRMMEFVKSLGIEIDAEYKEKFYSAFYFLLKQIYYYQFLSDDATMIEKVKKCLNSDVVKNTADYNQKAHVDFINQINMLKTKSFGEFCQKIMMEYNLQNSKKEKKISGKKVGKDVKIIEDDEQIYKHYRTLLYLGIRMAFYEYIKGNFGFLMKPRVEDRNISWEDWNSEKNTTYDNLRENIEKNKLLSAWYVTAHFITPRYLNHLIGDVKNYIQYIQDIESRSEVIENERNIQYKINEYLAVLEVLEFCKLFCGRVSNNSKDYFSNDDEYKKYLEKFVEVADVTKESIYYDAKNPILNRNIILSMMYGNSEVLSGVINKVNKDEIKEYKNSSGNLNYVEVGGTEENYKKMRKVQNLKNRVELVDVLTLTELLNDLYGQLISYCYLRERDLMFMQLGFYYMKLFHTDSLKDSDNMLRKLQGEDVNITDGAILYQIVALYSYALPIYGMKKEKVKKLLNRGTFGLKIDKFKGQYCFDKGEIYNAGLYLFQKNMHEKCINLRNYIDHFKYFRNQGKSILDMYSEMYEIFFLYDTKLKKSISYVLPNILLNYFVKVNLIYCIGENDKKSTKIKIAKNKLGKVKIESDYFKYNISEGKKKCPVPARETYFLETVGKMLEYKKEEENEE